MSTNSRGEGLIANLRRRAVPRQPKQVDEAEIAKNPDILKIGRKGAARKLAEQLVEKRAGEVEETRPTDAQGE